MLRRTALRALGAAAATAALGACSRTPAREPAETPKASENPPDPTNSPAAKAPVTTAPATPFAIERRDLDLSHGADRPLPTTLWSPAARGTYPLILFSHGFQAEPADYADLLTAWAKAGFVVAAPAYPHTSAGAEDLNVLDVVNQPGDASYVIGQVLKTGRVDPRRIAAAGHSAGGITTIGLFSGSRDDRLTAGVILAGERIIAVPFSGPSAPLLFVHGTDDRTVSYAQGRSAYAAVTWPKAFLTVTGGGHVATGRQLAAVSATTTDFWRWSLYGDPAPKSRLAADATKGNLATLEDELGV